MQGFDLAFSHIEASVADTEPAFTRAAEVANGTDSSG